MLCAVHLKLNTSTPAGTSPERSLAEAEYLVFRDIALEQRRLLHLRLVTSGRAFLIISSQDRPRFDTLYVEIGPTKVAFGKYNGGSSKETSSHPGIQDSPIQVWLFFDTDYIYIGTEATDVEEEVTIARFWSKDLDGANHLGLASSGEAIWVLSDGRRLGEGRGK